MAAGQEQEWIWTPSESQTQAASKLLRGLKERVDRLFFAFGELGQGRDMLKTGYEQTFGPAYREVSYVPAYQVNDDPNNIQLQSIARIKQGELIEALRQGGEFEIQNCYALIVFMYHLWDEYYRPRMAEALGLEQNGQLKADLFGDIRLIRNAIIHNQALLSESEYNNLKVLTTLEEIKPGEIKLTLKTIQVIVGSLDSLQIGITPPSH